MKRAWSPRASAPRPAEARLDVPKSWKKVNTRVRPRVAAPARRVGLAAADIRRAGKQPADAHRLVARKDQADASAISRLPRTGRRHLRARLTLHVEQCLETTREPRRILLFCRLFLATDPREHAPIMRHHIVVAGVVACPAGQLETDQRREILHALPRDLQIDGV